MDWHTACDIWDSIWNQVKCETDCECHSFWNTVSLLKVWLEKHQRTTDDTKCTLDNSYLQSPQTTFDQMLITCPVTNPPSCISVASQSDCHGQRPHFWDGLSSQPHRTAGTVLPNVSGSWADLSLHRALYHGAGVLVYRCGTSRVALQHTLNRAVPSFVAALSSSPCKGIVSEPQEQLLMQSLVF